MNLFVNEVSDLWTHQKTYNCLTCENVSNNLINLLRKILSKIIAHLNFL